MLQVRMLPKSSQKLKLNTSCKMFMTMATKNSNRVSYVIWTATAFRNFKIDQILKIRATFHSSPDLHVFSFSYCDLKFIFSSLSWDDVFSSFFLNPPPPPFLIRHKRLHNGNIWSIVFKLKNNNKTFYRSNYS